MGLLLNDRTSEPARFTPAAPAMAPSRSGAGAKKTVQAKRRPPPAVKSQRNARRDRG